MWDKSENHCNHPREEKIVEINGNLAGLEGGGMNQRSTLHSAYLDIIVGEEGGVASCKWVCFSL